MTAGDPIQIYPMASGSAPIVYEAYDKWSAIAQQAFATAQRLAGEVNNLTLDPVAFNAHYDPELALTGFPVMPKPMMPANAQAFTMPPLPSPPPTISIPTIPSLTYTADVIATLKDTVTRLLGGDPLAPAVAQALRDRALAPTFEEEDRAVAQAYDEFAARGFPEPSGQLSARVNEARADARAKRQAASRDVFIQEQTVAVENTRFAVTASVQYEQLNIDVFKAQVQWAISTIQVSQETSKLQLTAWHTQVEVFDLRLRAETAQLDAALKFFQAEVEAYTADVRAAGVAGDYDSRRFQLNMAQEGAIVQTEMKRKDQQFEQMKFITTIMLEVKKTLATVSSQLASSAMSAVNIGASLSSSTSQSIGYSLGLSYSGPVKQEDSL